MDSVIQSNGTTEAAFTATVLMIIHWQHSAEELVSVRIELADDVANRTKRIKADYALQYERKGCHGFVQRTTTS